MIGTSARWARKLHPQLHSPKPSESHKTEITPSHWNYAFSGWTPWKARNWGNIKNLFPLGCHRVHSTAGPIDGVLSGGLGGVFNRSINPTAFVRGQICRIVNWPEQEYKMFNETWREPVRDSIVYIGSTTGTSYDNFPMFSSRSDMARGSRVLDSVGTEHGPYVRRLVGVWPKHGWWCATGTISSSCCTLHLRHQRLVHCQLLLHVSWETIFDRSMNCLIESCAFSWLVGDWFGPGGTTNPIDGWKWMNMKDQFCCPLALPASGVALSKVCGGPFE